MINFQVTVIHIQKCDKMKIEKVQAGNLHFVCELMSPPTHYSALRVFHNEFHTCCK